MAGLAEQHERHDRLTAFLYLLMRDHLPTGAVKAVAERVIVDEEFTMSAPELAALAERYASGLLGEPAPAADDDEGEQERVRVVQAHEGVFLDEEGDEFPAGAPMLAWLDLFDDRIRAQETFVAAVNEAAENSLPLTEDTARIVAARARELAEAKGPADAG
jgi:hypothetical protein